MFRLAKIIWSEEVLHYVILESDLGEDWNCPVHAPNINEFTQIWDFSDPPSTLQWLFYLHVHIILKPLDGRKTSVVF